jgi:hypothetical protein
VVIKGTVHNGMIRFENSGLPEGTQVLITPVESPFGKTMKENSSSRKFTVSPLWLLRATPMMAFPVPITISSSMEGEYDLR